MTQEALSQLIECARLLGQTQAKKALGIYTEQDSRFEVAMYKSIHEHKAKIKEALAQTELCKYGQEPASCTSNPMDCQCAIDASLAQTQEPWCMKMNGCKTKCEDCPDEPPQRTEQEPVAWVSEDVCKGQYIDGRPRKIWWECEKGVGTAFYTTPPQRTWVELTDEDRLRLWLKTEAEDVDRYAFAKAVEAALKELNT